MRRATPSVSVIVLAYNNLELTRACIDSLLTKTRYPGEWELVVVDNASTDGTQDYLKDLCQEEPRIRTVINGQNLGFAAGMNVGIRASRGDYLALLNNDVIVTTGWLYGMVRHLRRDPGLFAVGPVTNSIGNEAQIDIHYGTIDDIEAASASYVQRNARRRYDTRTVAFFCTVMPRATVELVGLLDEGFGVGFFEDDDYCRRIEAAGGRVAIAEDVFIHHEHSATFNSMQHEDRRVLFERNRALYEAKWGPWVPHRYRGESE